MVAIVNSYYARRDLTVPRTRTQTRYLGCVLYPFEELPAWLHICLLHDSQNRYHQLPHLRIGRESVDGTKLSKLFDPETISGGNTDSNASAPIKSAGNAYPLSRTWSFGLSVSL